MNCEAQKAKEKATKKNKVGKGQFKQLFHKI